MAEKVRLLIVDDEEMFRKLLIERFTRQEFEVTGCDSAETALDIISEKEFDIGIVDIRMPGMNGIELFRTIRKTNPYFEAIILTGVATVDTAIEAMKQGVYDYLTKPCKLFELELVVRKAYEKKMLAVENARLKSSLTLNSQDYSIVGDSIKMAELREITERISTSQAPVLITGEPGSGKEYVARRIHQISREDAAPFISVNCGVHPHGIFENYLFGNERDMYTGASSPKTGWLELAEGGTLYLEDVDELHPSTQILLHRFMETGVYQKIGGNFDCRANVRIITSSVKDLRELVLKKHFREDLYYKLNVITLEIPSLRERKDDIPYLIEKFLKEKSSAGNGKKFSNKAINAMLKYEWPGNLRELFNVVERASLVTTGKTIQAKDIPINISKKARKTKDRHLLSLTEVEKDHILYVLSATGGNISRAARTLGISRPKLYRKISQYKTGGFVEEA